jgi:hypothetical protein
MTIAIAGFGLAFALTLTAGFTGFNNGSVHATMFNCSLGSNRLILDSGRLETYGFIGTNEPFT